VTNKAGCSHLIRYIFWRIKIQDSLGIHVLRKKNLSRFQSLHFLVVCSVLSKYSISFIFIDMNVTRTYSPLTNSIKSLIFVIIFKCSIILDYWNLHYEEGYLIFLILRIMQLYDPSLFTLKSFISILNY
jgi:hypothetical protein